MLIRKMEERDREAVFSMMRVFYNSEAVIHTSSNQVLTQDINACLDEKNPFLEGYVFLEEDFIIGYAMCSRNFTTEYGGLCIWLEDLYIKEEYRGLGFGTQFFQYMEKEFPEAVRFKLEVEKENESAVATYKKNGYQISEYFLMTKEMVEG